MFEVDKIICGDCLEVLRGFPDESINCCVTSPPYWGLRDYGCNNQLGLEKTPEEYVQNMVEVFREVKRVLRADGTLWLNLGDSYSGSGKGRNADGSHQEGGKQGTSRGTIEGSLYKTESGLKPKDLVGIPWMVAFALRADGWYLRADIIWHKPNPMPESVTDRPTKSHEYIFLLSKSKKYYYDAEAIKEESCVSDKWKEPDKKYLSKTDGNGETSLKKGFNRMGKIGETRNKRSVWTVTTKPFKKAHFATFPTKLIEPCILAGCPAKCCHECGSPWERVVERTTSTPGQKKGYLRDCTGRNDGDRAGSFTDMQSKTIGFTPTCKCNVGTTHGIVLDPFMGAGTVAYVAKENNRNYIGCELNPEYIKIAEQRITQAQPQLF